MNLLRFLSVHLGALKRVPLLPQVFEGLLLAASLVFRRPVFRSLQEIEQILAVWPGVHIHPHRFGGTQFDVNGREIGHLHGNGIVDIPLSSADADALLRAGEVVPHHTLPGTGWVSRAVRSRDDIADVVALLRRSYERHAGYKKATLWNEENGWHRLRQSISEPIR